jgi:septal ring factor EnvC (AmiA/AmiB activator)
MAGVVMRQSRCVRLEGPLTAGRWADRKGASVPAILALLTLAGCAAANPTAGIAAGWPPQANQAAAEPAEAGLPKPTGQVRAAAAPRPAVPRRKPETTVRRPLPDRERPRAGTVAASAAIAGSVPAAYAPASPAAEPDGYAWPVQGRIVRAFGEEPNGGRSDGIDIGVAEGSLVRAARGGTVAYAGSEIRGYGKMLLIAHAGGFTTVYARNRELLVRAGERVRRGQPIAAVGSADIGGPPRLHFQLRFGGAPLDPAPHLEVNGTVLASASLGGLLAAPGE